MSDRRALAGLGVAAGLTALIYAGAFLAPYPLARYYDTPLLDLGKITGYGRDAAVLFAGAYAALFGLYAVAHELARRASADRRARLILVGAPFLFALILLGVFPIGAIDVYDYTFYGRMLVHYDVSPLTHIPRQFADDAWLPYVGWPNATSPYGPLWQWLSAGIYTLAGESLLANLLGYKIVAAASVLGCGALVHAILRRAWPGDALAGWVFVAWNPLLLVEMAANGHNDALMAALILLAVLAFQRRHLTAMALALTAAMLVKFPALFAVPVFGIAALWRLPDWRGRLRWVLVAGASVLVVMLIAYLPLADGANPFANLLARSDLFTASLAAVAMLLLRQSLPLDQAQMLALTAAMGLFGLVLLWIALWRRGDVDGLAQGLFDAFLALLVLATLWFQPWYTAWILVLAPLAGSRSRKVAATLAISVLAIYIIYDFLLWWDPEWWAGDGGLRLNVVTVACVYVPPLAVLVGGRMREWRARRRMQAVAQA